MIPIAGYADRWSVGHNETIEFKVSSTLEQDYSVRMVRIVCADPNPDGPGIIEHDLSSVFSGQYPSRIQDVQLGSYARVPVNHRLPNTDEFALVARIWPSLVDCGPQSVLSLVDSQGVPAIELRISKSGNLASVIGNESGVIEEFSLNDTVLTDRRWYTVWLGIDSANSQLTLGQSPHESEFQADDEGISSYDLTSVQALDAVDRILVAASAENSLSAFYNGKIERPSVLGSIPRDGETANRMLDTGEQVLCSWDFSQGISTQRITDTGALKLDGELVNCPARAMRGSNWTGEEMCWRHAPEQYGAIHFHDDDIYDCQWETDFSFKVPAGFRSGMYSMRIECEGQYEDIPFYVRPKTGQPQSRICVLISTFTYTVYTNQARSVAGEDYDRLVAERGSRPWNTDEIQDYGLSTYNYHHDGSGIGYSSRLRPSLTMRPNYITICRPFGGSGMRHLPADTHLFSWLEHSGYEFDMVTDDDLHREGCDLLRPYQVVITCSHPEYHTSNTLDAVYEYSRSGGRLMYMGGNGFYWKVAVQDDLPGMVEIRRGEGGIRLWASEPGEYYNALDGEYGGLWLRNGRPPQKLTGVGFTAQGDFQGTYYRKNPQLPEEYEWVFRGIDDEILGNFGLSGGGAAGFELDRIDHALGTPRNAVVLASSETYPDHFVLVPEEWLTHLATRTGEPPSKLIRSDIVLFETAHGGYVFSVGSITYCGSLPWNQFDNNISKLTSNVLDFFLA